MVVNGVKITPFLIISVSLESSRSQLSSGTKIVNNGVISDPSMTIFWSLHHSTGHRTLDIGITHTRNRSAENHLSQIRVPCSYRCPPAAARKSNRDREWGQYSSVFGREWRRWKPEVASFSTVLSSSKTDKYWPHFDLKWVKIIACWVYGDVGYASDSGTLLL